MSQADIDLKGNTNFVALKNLNEEVVVPRTNLAAVDMTVANGLMVSGNTLYNNLAEPAEILEGSTSESIISTGNLYKALELGRKSYDLWNAEMKASSLSPNAYYKDENGIRTITGKRTGTNRNFGGMYWPAASQPIRKITGKFLFAVDVYNETVNSPALRIFKNETEFDNVTGFEQSTTTLNSWVTLAGLVDALETPYTASFDLQCFVPNVGDSLTFKLRNIRLIDVTGLTDDQISYIAGNPAPYLYKPGTGISMDAETISVEAADVGGTLDGTDDATITGERLHDILSVAKAVDVTSQPYASAGTLTYETAGDYRSKITWTGSGNAKLGFYDSSTHAFPKFASGLSYILLADVKNNTTGSNNLSLTFGGTPVNKQLGGIPVGETRRVAILFTSNSTGYFQINVSGSFSLEITNLREFEVTGCTDAARRYIAYMSNPDDFSKFYLVDYDEQNPWTKIIDMGNSPAVTLMAGLSYKLDASTGAHTITTDICPVGYYGEDAHLQVFVGNTANLSFQKPLSLMNPLTANAGHNMTIKYRDGQALAYVDDTDVGYVITVNSGTAANTLYYGLGEVTDKYLVFGAETDGTPVDLNGAVANKAEKYVVGNGYDKTTITGSGSFTSKTVFTRVSMDDVVVTGGTMTLGDVNIPNGATVAVSGGRLAIEKVVGDGGVLNLIGKPCIVSGRGILNGLVMSGGQQNVKVSGGQAVISNCVVTGGTAAGQGGNVYALAGANVTIVGSTIHTAYGTSAISISVTGITTVTLQNSIVGKTSSEGDRILVYDAGTLNISGSTVWGIQLQNAGGVCNLQGTVKLNNIVRGRYFGTTSGGAVNIDSGAIVNLTGNANNPVIATGGGITFASGGATVLYSSGVVSGSYMMDNVTLPSGAKLTNTAVVNLNSASVQLTSATTISASGATFANGSATRYSVSSSGTDLGGVIYLYSIGAKAVFSDCTFTGGNAAFGGVCTVRLGSSGGFTREPDAVFSNCFMSGNRAAETGGCIAATNGGYVKLTGCSATNNRVSGGGAPFFANGGYLWFDGLTGNNFTVLRGGSSYLKITSYNKFESDIIGDAGGGFVIIESGAVIDLTGNSNAKPINPGRGVTISGGGYDLPTVIVDSAGESRTFAYANITGTSITKLGLVYGATVTFLDSTSDYIVYYTPDNGTTFSSETVNGSTGTYTVTGALVQINKLEA